MESDSSSSLNPNLSSTGGRSSKRLLFDRRYGWVFDEWKSPSDETLAGGRGMFCIVPLAKAFARTASQSINLIGRSAVQILQKPELISPQVVQASVNDRLHKFISSIQKPEFNVFSPKASNQTSSSCTDSNVSQSA